ncbi:hypothetical protein PW52_12470 [Tamlana sedimentorum]|uniref:Uncharacterized protein n=1 Tax=Neotamlana sedimentorum TaxID=1435349 RepID=A0A0D7W709_9FLAO|nr:hypothetical protein [Tamlana sedimentorum]KJD34916.1 hypothetical protein PW52_12470 [Tamlana sedimentorum]
MINKTGVCTLFEGHYHFGVATLSNSLYQNGYRGNIYVGYRGDLPPWVINAEKIDLEPFGEITTFKPSLHRDIILFFIPLNTKYSLTNYKPDFMLDLLNGPAQDIESIFYFDPDIVVNKSWDKFEDWVNCGVAVCEDVNSPIPEFHPRRVGWRSYYKDYDFKLQFKSNMYVNGGFIGVKRSDFSFLNIWKDIQECMGEAIGGLENSIFANLQYKSTIPERKGFQIFDKSDQDALNVSIEVFNGDVSIIGSESMGFKEGYSLMSHALGSPKPWKAKLLSRALNGITPRATDVAYWQLKNFPFKAHSNMTFKRKIISIYIAKLINRFYKK